MKYNKFKKYILDNYKNINIIEVHETPYDINGMYAIISGCSYDENLNVEAFCERIQNTKSNNIYLNKDNYKSLVHEFFHAKCNNLIFSYILMQHLIIEETFAYALGYNCDYRQVNYLDKDLEYEIKKNPTIFEIYYNLYKETKREIESVFEGDLCGLCPLRSC